jgi:iron complex outermembrane receptor protein
MNARIPALLLHYCLILSLFAVSGRAAEARSTIEGRVLNADTGRYVSGARVSVPAATVETLTDESGFYRLPNLPAGPVKVQVFFTGLKPQSADVPVTSGQTARQDFSLSAAESATAAGAGGVVVLDAFAVASRREMEASAIAINEQRIAPNIKNVVSADEFGGDVEGNVGEFLKFLPGMSVSYAGGNARSVSLGGAPAAYVPMTIGGFSVASPGLDSGTNRSVAVDFLSLNNLSRIEVEFVPTPESQGGALAGTVNMVPRSAFERSRPVLNVSTYLTMRDDARDFHKSAGPYRQDTRKVHPGADFSYVVPVNAKFGFTLSGSHMTQYAPEDILALSWRGVSLVTNGAAFPHTTPDRPYLSAIAYTDGGKETIRRSLAATFDFKLGRYDQISLGYQYAFTRIQFVNRFITFSITQVAPGGFSPTSTRSTNGGANVLINTNGRFRDVPTRMPTITWRHHGPVWRAEAGFGLSQSFNLFRDIQKGQFMNPRVQRTGLTMAFNDFSAAGHVPGQIVVTDGATGVPVDPYRLDNYSLLTGNTNEARTEDVKRTLYGNIRRDFQGPVPFSLKAGFDFREAVRDTRGSNGTWSYVGRDGRASTTPVGNDDSAGAFVDQTNASNHAPYGLPRFQSADSWRVYEHYVSNPGSFRLDEPAEYTNRMNLSKHAEELVSAGFLRGDLSLFRGQLKLTGGLRAEQTNINAEGPLNDPTRNFQRDAAGRLVLGANGRPLLISPAGSVEALQRTLVDRGANTKKEYLRLFPSLNATYSVRENLLLRAGHFTSVGRPDFNQYSGGLQLPDTELPAGPGNRIAVSNSGIKAWSAQTTMTRLEHYFQGVGMISIGAFRREFKDFFGTTVTRVSPDLLALYALDPDVYGAYDVSTQYNLAGRVVMQGWDVNYKQALTFLPAWARGVQVFANFSEQRTASGAAAEAANLAGFVPRSANWGLSLTRQKFNVRVNWNYRGRAQNGPVAAGTGIEAGTYNFTPERLTYDIIGEYYFLKRFAVYANLRNVSDEPVIAETQGPSTPGYAVFRQSNRYASLWTVGLKATF